MATRIRESIWQLQIPLSMGLALALLGFLLGYGLGGLGAPSDPFAAEHPAEAALARLLTWGAAFTIGWASRGPLHELIAAPRQSSLLLVALAFLPVTVTDLLATQLAVAFSSYQSCAPGAPPPPPLFSLPRAAILGTTVLLTLLAAARHVANRAAAAAFDPAPAPRFVAPAMPGEWLDLPEAPLLRIRADDVTLIRSAGNYSEIVANGRVHLVRATLSELAHRFAPLCFVRVHRQTVVNARLIREVCREPGGRPVIHLSCGTALPLGRRYRDAMKALV